MNNKSLEWEPSLLNIEASWGDNHVCQPKLIHRNVSGPAERVQSLVTEEGVGVGEEGRGTDGRET